MELIAQNKGKIMARAPLKNHCIHGVYNGPPQNIPVDIELNGVIHNFIPAFEKCWKCQQEKENREQEEKYRQEQESALVKRNILQLLKEDEDFRKEMKELLNGDNSSNNEKKDITNYV